MNAQIGGRVGDGSVEQPDQIKSDVHPTPEPRAKSDPVHKEHRDSDRACRPAQRIPPEAVKECAEHARTARAPSRTLPQALRLRGPSRAIPPNDEFFAGPTDRPCRWLPVADRRARQLPAQCITILCFFMNFAARKNLPMVTRPPIWYAMSQDRSSLAIAARFRMPESGQ